ncbi:MAG TPA: acyl-CoA desaturase [Cyclobacteriaceae bacterium]|nr:acyl-CoA desaturase [Cyclobacteriaceae bacterium]
MPKVTFDNQSSFFRTLKEKVDKYFADHKLDPTGNSKLYLKSILQISSALALYIVLVFFTPPTALAVILCGILGLNLAVIGFNVMHEGSHHSFSKYAWLNKASGYFLNVMGGNAYYWKIKHNINHHTFTNIDGMDSDIDVRPWMRLHPSHQRRWFHRFQHIYFVVLYGLSYFAWIFIDDFKKYISGRVTPDSKPKRIALKEHLIFWATKVMYCGFYIGLPIMMVGLSSALIGYSIMVFVCGVFISVVFQLAHVVEATEFTAVEEEVIQLPQSWAVHQLKSTANFATSNKVLSWFLGGLNFQIEHHLFPNISHVHYPQVSRMVREVCKEYNIDYLEYSSMLKAFSSHLLHLRRLSIA